MSNINVDSTQAIMDATKLQGGKWQFVYDDEVIAEATAPSKATADTIEEWCAAVRGRIRARTEIDEAEMIARKKRRREDDGIPIATTTPDRGSATGGRIDATAADNDGRSGGVASFEEDPELYALEQVKGLSERQTALEEELKQVIKSRRKWGAIAAAAQQAGDEDV